MTRIVVYLRVSTEEQGESGLGLADRLTLVRTGTHADLELE
jgi:hypothetical protein